MGEISFLAVPTREVTDPSGVQWRVQIRGGWGRAAKGPEGSGRFGRWLNGLNWDQADMLALIPLAWFVVAALPYYLWTRLAYAIKRRTDWWAEAVMFGEEDDVTVAAFREPTKEVAAERALVLLAEIRAGRLAVEVREED